MAMITDQPQLPGHYFSFKTGGNPNEVVDRFEARAQDSNRVTYYRNGPVGSKSRVNSATANPMESYSVSGNKLIGPVTGTIKPNGDIEYSHGYTSRKEAETTGGDRGSGGGKLVDESHGVFKLGNGSITVRQPGSIPRTLGHCCTLC